MSNCDVLPTLASLAGVNAPPDVQGRPVSEWGASDDRCVFAFCINGTRKSVNYTVYDGRRRLTWWPGCDWVELFDHREDPEEARNVAGDPGRKRTVAELKQAIREHLVDTHAPITGRVSPW